MFDPKILNSSMNGSKYNLLIKDNLSIKDKCFDFVLVPKCPSFRGSTVSIDSTYTIDSTILEATFAHVVIVLSWHNFSRPHVSWNVVCIFLQEIMTRYNSRGERSIEDSAKLVGLKLPENKLREDILSESNSNSRTVR